jgi:hypothetical protein
MRSMLPVHSMLSELELLDDTSALKFVAEVMPMFSFKGLSVVLVAALTIAGVAGEVAGRDDGNARVASGPATKLELRDSRELRKLRVYAGTPVVVRAIDAGLAQSLNAGFVAAGSGSEAEASGLAAASEHLAQSLDRLETNAHWKYRRAAQSPGLVHDGITLLSWGNLSPTPNHEEQRAFQAAQGLRCVLYQQLGVWPVYWKATTLPEYPALPKNGVLVEIGRILPESKFPPEFGSPQFARCSAEIDAAAAR